MQIKKITPRKIKQQGASLIELMIGVAIGLVTIAVAMGSLVMSRGVSGTVSEISQLQQQSSHAFRVIGQQLRQAGSRQIDPDSSPFVNAILVDLPSSYKSPISGSDDAGDDEYTLTINYQNVDEMLAASEPGEDPEVGNQIRNCLQENPGATSSPVLSSKIKMIKSNNTLVCQGSGDPQVLVRNVKDFSVKYLVQKEASNKLDFKYVTATEASSAWLDVYGVQICLELEGMEKIDTAGAQYTKCDGTKADRGNKVRMVFNNTYHIRNHAWLGY